MAHLENQSCIDACVRCAEACDHCAIACLSEKDVGMLAECIRLDMDCSAICWGAAAFMSRGSRFARALCGLCAEICDACGAECGKHQDMEHCRVCAEACRVCAEACRACAEECRRMAQ